MSMVTGWSQNPSVELAVQEVKSQMSCDTPRMVLFFASPCFEPAAIAREMQDAFPGAAVLGCSTAGEVYSGKMLKKSLVAMALDSRALKDVKIEVVENISQENHIRQAFASFGEHFGVPMSDMDVDEYVGLVLFDGMSGAEEGLMETMGDLTNVLFVGGSAGDDLQFRATHVYANGQAFTNAAALALLKPAVPFSVLKTQSFRATGQPLLPTKVDEAHRKVLEFNGKPAAVAYAEAVDSSPEKAAEHFMRHPVGLMIGDEPYVRSPQQVAGDALVFYCLVREGMELSLLESTDIIADTREALATRIQEMGHVSGVVNFHCILRTLQLEKEGLTQQYGEIFSDVPTIGFSTYGEAYLGHINQTSTMLLLG